MRLYDSLRQASLWDGWIHRLLPVLLPALVVGIAVLLYDSTANSKFQLDLTTVEIVSLEQAPSAEQMVRAIEVRFAWATAQLVLGIAMVVAIVLAFVTSVRTLGGALPVAVGLISSVIGIVIFVYRSEGGIVIMPFASKLFAELECVGQHWFGGGINSWTETTAITEGLLPPLIALIGLAFSSLLWPVRREEPTGTLLPLTIDDLRVRRQMAGTLINCSAVVLVSFLVEFYTILRWPVVAVVKPEPVIAMAYGVVAWTGTFFTLILAAMAIPVTMSLSRQAGECALAKRLTTPSNVKNWLHTEGFVFSGWRRAPEILAVAGPSAVGVAGLPIVEALIGALT